MRYRNTDNYLDQNGAGRCHEAEAMIFDLDGTLIDSLADIADATNSTLEFFGLPTHPLESYRRFVGSGVSVLIKRALPENAPQPPADRFVAVFKERYRYHLNRKTVPYPGVTEALSRMNEKGTRLAVLSNKPDEFTKQCIATFFPDIRFSAVFGQRDGIPPKPDARAALEIAEQFALKPAQCAFVGDSDIDIKTGKAASMFCIGVSWGFRECDELVSSGADVIVDHPEELLRYATHLR